MKPKRESDTALPMVIGVDIGKEVFTWLDLAPTGSPAFAPIAE
jgi:hypothetical protein